VIFNTVKLRSVREFLLPLMREDMASKFKGSPFIPKLTRVL
jgi:hypothetical protein